MNIEHVGDGRRAQRTYVFVRPVVLVEYVFVSVWSAVGNDHNGAVTLRAAVRHIHLQTPAKCSGVVSLKQTWEQKVAIFWHRANKFPTEETCSSVFAGGKRAMA